MTEPKLENIHEGGGGHRSSPGRGFIIFISNIPVFLLAAQKITSSFNDSIDCPRVKRSWRISRIELNGSGSDFKVLNRVLQQRVGGY